MLNLIKKYSAPCHKFLTIEWHENVSIFVRFFSKIVGSVFFWFSVSLGFILTPLLANLTYKDLALPREVFVDLTKLIDYRFLPIAIVASVIFILIVSFVKAIVKNINATKINAFLNAGLDDALGQIIGLGSIFIATSGMIFVLGKMGATEAKNLSAVLLFKSGLWYWLYAYIGYWIGCRLFIFNPSIPVDE